MAQWKKHNKWIIEYWNSTDERVECFSCEHGSWLEAPISNVLYVYVQYKIRGKIYTHVVSGYDFYFFNEETNHFGGSNDYFDPDWGYGREYILEPKGESLLQVFWDKPTHIDGNLIKFGVWLDPPYDKLLGFVGTKRLISDCRNILLNGD